MFSLLIKSEFLRLFEVLSSHFHVACGHLIRPIKDNHTQAKKNAPTILTDYRRLLSLKTIKKNDSNRDFL